MPARLIDCLTSTIPLAEIFSDESVLQAMLDFEAALARVEARLAIIPETAVQAIAQACRAADFDISALSAESFRAGTPAIPLVRMLTERVRQLDAAAAGFVHWGATSQDVSDTALLLLLKRAGAVLAGDHERLMKALRQLSEAHANTIMLGRTLLQPALPVTFGLKAAGWFGAARRGWPRVASRLEEALYLQFGGAAGTLAALGNRGLAVAEALAQELDLKLPDAPWHAHRDRLGALAAALSIYAGSLGKMALDIALLMQWEVAEAAEPGGGSSSMPHKRNPTACLLTIAAARRTPGLLANFLSGMLQEHERGAGNWQSEWTLLPQIVQSVGVALESMAEAAEGLTVDPARMKRNLESTRGTIFAEKAVMTLAPTMGREAARHQVEDELKRTGALASMSDTRPEEYLGSAELFRQRLMEED